jgi:hypothetical protein
MNAHADAISVLETDLEGASRHGDVLRTIFDRRLTAVIVRGAFSAMRMSTIIESLAQGNTGVPRMQPWYFQGPLFGRPLAYSAPGLHLYLEDAERFRGASGALFGEGAPEGPILTALGALSGERPVRRPLGHDGRPYLGATIRVLEPFDRLPPHFENESFQSPTMEALGPLVEKETMMSYLVQMAEPEAGGELWVYAEGLEGRGAEPGRAIALGAGDLVVFDAGRYRHEVTPVRGSKARWTMGGFLAFSRDHRLTYVWS